MDHLKQFCVTKGKLLDEEGIKENKYIYGETGWNINKVIHACNDGSTKLVYWELR